MDLITQRNKRSEPSFTLKNRLARVLWNITYLLLIRYSPVFLKRWRIFIYRLFSKNIHKNTNIYPRAKVWAPWNLRLQSGACIANDAYIYNQDEVVINKNALISQGAFICTGSHDYNSKTFKLVTKPIVIGEHAWIAAEAFVGPGVEICEGAVLGARGVTFKNLKPWTVYSGNPACEIKNRKVESDWI
ncbi:MAG: hypothetical protein ABJV04_14065 [Aliiglaciecola sp.]|uniref:hypothetical protein n=1 Tax=Aliiglaciecola sp. TaxID=1872441 RepID=UPI003299BB0D